MTTKCSSGEGDDKASSETTKAKLMARLFGQPVIIGDTWKREELYDRLPTFPGSPQPNPLFTSITG